MSRHSSSLWISIIFDLNHFISRYPSVAMDIDHNWFKRFQIEASYGLYGNSSYLIWTTKFWGILRPLWMSIMTDWRHPLVSHIWCTEIPVRRVGHNHWLCWRMSRACPKTLRVTMEFWVRIGWIVTETSWVGMFWMEILFFFLYRKLWLDVKFFTVRNLTSFWNLQSTTWMIGLFKYSCDWFLWFQSMWLALVNSAMWLVLLVLI